jgi:hypothetical protein
VHLAVLSHFVRTGQAPRRGRLAQLLGDRTARIEGLLRELASCDVIALGRDGQIRAAYPFSPVATGIEVTWAGGPAAHAMCAVDALGMSAMLDRPVVIRAREPGTAATITVRVDDDQDTWQPSTAVVYAAAIDDRCCPSVDRTCRYINFFTTVEAATGWAAEHPEVSGVLLNQTEALAIARQEFGDLMRGDGR